MPALHYLDSNVLIALIEPVAARTAGQADFIAKFDRGEFFAVASELALSECLVKPLADGNAHTAAAYHDLFSASSSLLVMGVTRAILVAAANLRARSRLKLPDAIHLATATEAECIAFVTNDRDFKAAEAPFDIVRWDQLD